MAIIRSRGRGGTCCDNCTCPGCCPLPSTRGAVTTFGADDASAPAFSIPDALNSDTVKTASAIALTYHGYKRTGSIVWALIYGLVGRFKPVVAVPIAVAQGFGAKKPCP